MMLATTVRRTLMCSIATVGVVSIAAQADNPRDMDKAAKAGKVDGKWHEGYKADKKAHKGMINEAIGAELRPAKRDQVSQYRDLKFGTGLIVGEVAADSLAAKAGLKTGDVVYELGDQWVINVEQFCTLLALQEANDEFEISVYRTNDGNDVESVDIDLRLDQVAIDNMRRQHDEIAMGALDQTVTREIDMNRDRVDNPTDTPRADNPLDGGLVDNRTGQAGLIIPEKFDYSDDLHSFDLRTNDDGKKLTIKDKDGNVLFEGPYNTQAERDAVPLELRDKFQRVLREKVK